MQKIIKCISTYNHLHIDRYDTKNHLIRNLNIFPRPHFFLSTNSDKTPKMKKITKYINLKTPTY